MCRAKIHSFYKMRNLLCQNCPVLKYQWRSRDVETLRLRRSCVHTVPIIFAVSLFCFFLSFLMCVHKYLCVGLKMLYRRYPKPSFVCSVHLTSFQASFQRQRFWFLCFSPKISLVFPLYFTSFSGATGFEE